MCVCVLDPFTQRFDLKCLFATPNEALILFNAKSRVDNRACVHKKKKEKKLERA